MLYFVKGSPLKKVKGNAYQSIFFYYTWASPWVTDHFPDPPEFFK